jgi:hypothetical protein
MLLYRLLGVFSFSSGDDIPSPEPPLNIVNPSEPATSVWHTELVHGATGIVVRFGDYRGAAAVWLDAKGGDVGSFGKDLVSLLELLCSEKCPHTYAGIVAGTVG